MTVKNKPIACDIDAILSQHLGNITRRLATTITFSNDMSPFAVEPTIKDSSSLGLILHTIDRLQFSALRLLLLMELTNNMGVRLFHMVCGHKLRLK
jgi:hypothetical protein